MSITDILSLVFIAYIVLVFIKVMLMLPSAPVAFAVHTRYINKHSGVPFSKAGLWVCVIATVFLGAFLGVIRSLSREGPKFFVMYPTRQVIRETFISCRMLYPF